ncbi:nuclear transport factor 2 family protein [Mycobacterium sp. Aquia_216]|uniref:nuclear transport factor 2 family protein n=1 Tax=Mycobacterium sp. Aquia_216 TaxID=2991729 RepID=UPI00227C5370|nr:nuclear transport factor 2 family protein [Mycobacterium sp. Aquia_216]WAJ44252.1 nuclear transport factor 2 family protein [Mycobacterium sp. Aquia_216]
MSLPAAPEVDEMRTRAAVEGFYDGMLTADLAAVEAVLHPDVAVSEPGSLPYGGEHVGVDAVVKLLGLLCAGIALDDVRRGDVLVRGERAAAFLEVPFTLADGSSQFLPVVETFLVKYGLIMQIRPYYFDTAALLASLSAAAP